MRRFYYNFFKYLRYGGVVNLKIAQIKYGEILKNRKILITGGSSGIGYAMARKFLEAGAKVTITGKNEYKLLEAARKLNHDQLYIKLWDISKIQGIENNLEDIIEQMNGLDVLINNAGILINKSYEEMTEEDWNALINTNLKSVYFLSREVCNYFKKIKTETTKKLINISSMSGYITGFDPYNISKFGINSITAGLAKLYTKNNIVVNAIAPGYTATNMVKHEYQTNAYINTTLNKRIAIPEEIADLALFLVSDAANNIIGQTIIIDGGQSIL